MIKHNQLNIAVCLINKFLRQKGSWNCLKVCFTQILSALTCFQYLFSKFVKAACAVFDSPLAKEPWGKESNREILPISVSIKASLYSLSTQTEPFDTDFELGICLDSLCFRCKLLLYCDT